MLVIAHRGASVAAPENTPEAFALADEMDADGVELDVRIAPDGRLIVRHDPLPAPGVELDEVLATAAGLDGVLDACGTRMLVNVEIKNGGASAPTDPSMAVVAPTLAALRDRTGGDLGRWLVSSFSPHTLDAVRATDPSFATALLVEGRLDTAVDDAVAGGHPFLHPDVEHVDAAVVAAAHSAGIGVTAWTSNEPERIADLARLGLDGICTDVPDVALASLGDSGLRVRRRDERPRWPGPRA